MIKLIWAEAKDGLIGAEGSLPWHNGADLNYFRNQTTGGIVVMGHTTWKSIGQRPLKNRINIVLTHKDEIEGYDEEEVYIANNVEEIIDFYELSNKDLWIIGGASVYKQFIPYCDEFIVSLIEGDYSGDTYFTEMNEYKKPENIIVTFKGDGFTATHYRKA